MDVFLSTGERSGDAMAAGLAEELQRLSPRPLDIAALAGPLSAAAGVRVLHDYTDLSMTGVHGGHMRRWYDLIFDLATALNDGPPRAFVGVTHCTFNLPLGGMLRGTHRVLVGPPEVWAWRVRPLWRFAGPAVRGIAHLPLPVTWRMFCQAADVTCRRGDLPLQNFDEVHCLLPMNAAAYTARRGQRRRASDAEVRFLGHPAAAMHHTPDLARHAAALRQELEIPSGTHLLGLFPGSRQQEIDALLPTFLAAAARVLHSRDDVSAVVHVADPRFRAAIEEHLRAVLDRDGALGRVRATDAPVFPLLCACSHAMMSSGTLTLQAGLLGVRATVGYRTAASSRGRALVYAFVAPQRRGGVPVPFALPNAIAWHQGRAVGEWPYDEHVEDAFRPAMLAPSVLRALPSAPYDPSAHPALPPDEIERLRTAVRGPGSEPPLTALAERILARIG